MNPSCCICEESFTGISPGVVHATKCGHLYHMDCLDKWLTRSKTCPICRATIFEGQTIRVYMEDSSTLGPNEYLEDLINSISQIPQLLSKEKFEIVNKKCKDISSKILKSVRLHKDYEETLERQVEEQSDQIASLKNQLNICKKELKEVKERHLNAYTQIGQPLMNPDNPLSVFQRHQLQQQAMLNINNHEIQRQGIHMQQQLMLHNQHGEINFQQPAINNQYQYAMSLPSVAGNVEHQNLSDTATTPGLLFNGQYLPINASLGLQNVPLSMIGGFYGVSDDDNQHSQVFNNVPARHS